MLTRLETREDVYPCGIGNVEHNEDNDRKMGHMGQ